MKMFKRHRLLTLLSWGAIIAIWFVVSTTGMVESVLLPSPLQVLHRFADILKKGYNNISLWVHLGVSFKRLLLATFFAIITALPLGLLSGYSERIRAVVDSLVHFYRPLPPLAYYTLLVLWMGIDDASKVMLLFLAAFAPIYISCVSAVTSIPEDYLLSARSLGASESQIFLHIVLPASLPMIFTGIRTAFGFAYTTLVSAEMVAATTGIGWMVIDASKYLKSDVMFVGIIIMGITGILIDVILRKIEKRLIFWKGNK